MTAMLNASTCAAIRERLRTAGWRVLAYTEGRHGTQALHHYAFSHNNGSWVSGQGVTELSALEEVETKIRKYALSEGPLPNMPYETSRVMGGLLLRFAVPEQTAAFQLWLERLTSNEKRG